jgi:hypothetical protein
MLHRYWLKCAFSSKPSSLNLGCGITAYNEADARRIFEETVVPVHGPREILEIIEDIDISTLEANHVRLNMGVPVYRGVWFPLLR